MTGSVMEHNGAQSHEDPSSAAPGHGRALDYISASRLTCWQQCRRKHYFRYVANIPSGPSPAMHLGKVVHATLQQWNLWRWDRKPWTRDELHTQFFHQWEKEGAEHTVPWKSDKEHDTLRDKAWELVSAYLDAAVIDEGEDIAGVEVRLEAEIEGLPTIIGIVDLVREGGRIVDFKTTARSPSEDSAAFMHSTQLGIYALLYRHCTGKRETGLELHHLVKTKVPKVCITRSETVSDSEISNLVELMRRHVAAVKSGDTTPSPSFMCAGCEYLEQCKRWPDSMEGGAS